MPIYEYTCRSCGHAFSHLHKRLGEAAPPCPNCGSQDIKKNLSSFSARTGGPSCQHADSCPSAQESGHSCCPGCCHHHH